MSRATVRIKILSIDWESVNSKSKSLTRTQNEENQIKVHMEYFGNVQQIKSITTLTKLDVAFIRYIVKIYTYHLKVVKFAFSFFYFRAVLLFVIHGKTVWSML